MQRGWTGVSNIIRESKGFSIGAKLPYAMLLKFASEMDECFSAREQPAKDMGKGIKSMIRYIAELEDVG